jgi:hypothetical protein
MVERSRKRSTERATERATKRKEANAIKLEKEINKKQTLRTKVSGKKKKNKH